jgi:hypothetical protein
MKLDLPDDYIFLPELDLDLDLIKQIVMRNLKIRSPGLGVHQRLVSKEPYLEQLQIRYPWLSSIYNIYSTRWDHVTPVHVDSHRACALNIPISNVEGSSTVYYSAVKDSASEFVEERSYHVINGSLTETFRFCLSQPTIINTQFPHSIEHNGIPRNRIIMSWSVISDYTFHDIKRLLGRCGSS